MSGSVTINGKTITDNEILVNGKPIEEYKEPFRVEITIKGNVQDMTVENSPVRVEGKVGVAMSKNGNVSIKGNVLGNVESKNGNITVAGDVHGDATTKNGNIF